MFSLDFVHNFLGISHLQPHHPAAPIQLKSRWICQDRAGSQEFHVEKPSKNASPREPSMNSISVKKLSKTHDGARRTVVAKPIGVLGGVPLAGSKPLPKNTSNFVWQLNCVVKYKENLPPADMILSINL